MSAVDRQISISTHIDIKTLYSYSLPGSLPITPTPTPAPAPRLPALSVFMLPSTLTWMAINPNCFTDDLKSACRC